MMFKSNNSIGSLLIFGTAYIILGSPIVFWASLYTNQPRIMIGYLTLAAIGGVEIVRRKLEKSKQYSVLGFLAIFALSIVLIAAFDSYPVKLYDLLDRIGK